MANKSIDQKYFLILVLINKLKIDTFYSIPIFFDTQVFLNSYMYSHLILSMKKTGEDNVLINDNCIP